MSIIRSIRYTILAFSLTVSSQPIFATVDAETPEQVLEVLRLLLLEKTVHNELAKMKNAGCVWHSEFIWFYANEQLSEGVFQWGGNLIVQFQELYSPEQSIAFRFSGRQSVSEKSISSLTLESVVDYSEQCQ